MYNKIMKCLFIISIVTLTIFLCIDNTISEFGFKFMDRLFMVIIIVGFTIIVCRVTFGGYEFKIRSEIEDFYSNARDTIANNENEKFDAIELMLLNMKEIKEYYILSKAMAKRSFLLSVFMCILGFIIISASIVSMFFIDVSFIQSIIPVIGGSVVEMIAGTSLVVYKKSLEQLNQYYESLHNNERFLSLVNLVNKLSSDKKDETYINIINNQLEVLKKTQ